MAVEQANKSRPFRPRL